MLTGMSETPPPSYYGSPQQGPDPTPQPRPDGGGPGRSRGTGLAVGVLVGALLLGGAAGVGGAAAYDQWWDDDNGASSAPDRSTPSRSDTGSSDSDAGVEGVEGVEGVAEEVLPSVVRIDVETSDGGGSGSGIILTETGRILTNNHVIEGAAGNGAITVSFSDGTRASAEVLGADPLTDTAVIQAEDVSGQTPAAIGNSDDLRVGQPVVAIGSPFGLDATVTYGIVSALARPVNVGAADNAGNTTTYPAIQTDAAINPGNSGGPLVDLDGRVVGINSSIRTASDSTSGQSGSIGLGFAIPIDDILPVIDQMAKGETPTHARMGVQVTDAATAGNSDAPGALIRSVTPGSSAAKAGLEDGDIITGIDGQPIDSADDLVATVRTYRPGDEVELTYERDGKEESTQLALDSDGDSD